MPVVGPIKINLRLFRLARTQGRDDFVDASRCRGHPSEGRKATPGMRVEKPEVVSASKIAHSENACPQDQDRAKSEDLLPKRATGRLPARAFRS